MIAPGRVGTSPPLSAPPASPVCGRLRVSIRLIGTATDTHRWAETFDGNSQDIFDIQDRIASRVVEKLKVSFDGGGSPEASLKYTNSVDAYDAYLRARRVLSSGTTDDHLRAIPILREAIAAGWLTATLL